MKERPILFSGETVRAILEGRKTQTRRVVKPQPDFTYGSRNVSGGNLRNLPFQVGQTLWVRETWFYDRTTFTNGPNKPRDFDARDLYFRADGTCCQQVPECCCAEVGSPWRPSIHMPRWASRLTLEITGVRVERLQEISEEDAKAEGVEPGCLTCGENCIDRGGCGYCRPAYRDSFCYLWDKLNASRGYSWDSNPFVWVVEFQPHPTPAQTSTESAGNNLSRIRQESAS